MDRNMKTPTLPPLYIQIDIRAPYDREYRATAGEMMRAMPGEIAACGCSCNRNAYSGVPRPHCANPENTIWLCDTDAAIQKRRSEGVPVIAVSHAKNASEELMGTPWLILSPEALTTDFLYEIYCRHHGLPLIVTGTSRCLLRELTMEDYPALSKLQQENAGNPEGCFFPADINVSKSTSPDNPTPIPGQLPTPDRNAEWKDFLANYIAHQYPFFGFGLYAILHKASGKFMGIAGFAQIIAEDFASDRTLQSALTCSDNKSGESIGTTPNQSLRAEVSYSLLRQFQHQGYAEEVLRALMAYGRKEGGFGRFVARIRPENTASLALARRCGIVIEYLSRKG